ncbi:MAG: YjjG family noncanonical pyrimidine nucleotidase [Muribaculaceae bacterium]|nr:YjjG family noncanonical pyrimidine nucleotidase [Muribaculaceae bacterium]
MGKFTAILWDLDQTILDFNKSRDYALPYTFHEMGLEINAEQTALYLEINDSYWKRLERGEITKDEVHYGRFRTLFEKLGITGKSPEKMEEIYQDALSSVVFFRDNADEIIARLKEQGFRQYVITNGFYKTASKKMSLSGLDKLMDGVFVSEVIGVPKPQKEYFDACFAQMDGITRKECLLVGDSLTSDMQGGINAGIATCWYNPAGLPNTPGLAIDYEIQNLQELFSIL